MTLATSAAAAARWLYCDADIGRGQDRRVINAITDHAPNFRSARTTVTF
jgi:hypothetical protein